jgi:putative transposase
LTPRTRGVRHAAPLAADQATSRPFDQLDPNVFSYAPSQSPKWALRRSIESAQYAATDYRKLLNAAKMIQSMSRKGNCWDNAPMESCFGTIKTELVHQACYPTREAARHDLFADIEGYYNRQRLHSALGYITPELAERQAA